MRKLRVISSIIVFLVFIGLIVVKNIASTTIRQDSYYCALFLSSSNNLSLREEDDQPLFSFDDANQTEDVLFTLPAYELDCLECINRPNSIYSFREETYLYKQIEPNLYFICFEKDSYEMARQISLFTDNLATHDCLFRCSLQRVLYNRISPIIHDQSYSLNDKIEQMVKAQSSNIKCFLYSRLRTKNNTIDGVTIDHSPLSFQFCYHSEQTGIDYLFEQIPLYEKGWNLYYYPTILVNYSCSYDVMKCVSQDANGTLYSNDGLRFSNSTYYYYTDGRFIRTVGGHMPIDRKPEFNDYSMDTMNANDLIRQFLSEI